MTWLWRTVGCYYLDKMQVGVLQASNIRFHKTDAAAAFVLGMHYGWLVLSSTRSVPAPAFLGCRPG